MAEVWQAFACVDEKKRPLGRLHGVSGLRRHPGGIVAGFKGASVALDDGVRWCHVRLARKGKGRVPAQRPTPFLAVFVSLSLQSPL